jgi:hypothetical protein
MAELGQFFDPETGGEARFVLERDRPGVFRMQRQFGYHDPEVGTLIVPADVKRFRTDLTSVPWFFAWLIPPLGEHLPPALLHDALVLTDAEPQAHCGPPVDRDMADRIFRDAMRIVGTPFSRRWLIWAGASIGTIAARSWRAKLLLSLYFVGLATLGVVSTLDLFDVGPRLPWLGDRPWTAELLIGGALAVGIPAVLALASWGRYRLVGIISGVALAAFLHATLLVIATYLVYRSFELRTTEEHTHSRNRLALRTARSRAEDLATKTSPIAKVGKFFRAVGFFAWYRFRPKRRPPRYAPGQTGVYSPPDPTDEPVRVALAADWADGKRTARAVAASIVNDDPHYAIHLGDIYHVGAEHEIIQNCLGGTHEKPGVTWPLDLRFGSFAVPGNHEYNSGGRAFFTTFVPKLGPRNAGPEGQITSYFCIDLERWRLIGLDTGFRSAKFLLHEGAVYVLNQLASRLGRPHLFADWKTSLPKQMTHWLRDQVRIAESGDKGVIVLTHHQYFTALDKRGDNPKLGKQLAELLGPTTIIWLWGHEHRLAVYGKRFEAPADGLQVFGRAIGNGSESDPVADLRGARKAIVQKSLTHVDNRENHGGYVELLLDGPRLTIEYRTLSEGDAGPPRTLLTERFEVDGNGVVIQVDEPSSDAPPAGFITPEWMNENFWPPPPDLPDELRGRCSHPTLSDGGGCPAPTHAATAADAPGG